MEKLDRWELGKMTKRALAPLGVKKPQIRIESYPIKCEAVQRVLLEFRFPVPIKYRRVIHQHQSLPIKGWEDLLIYRLADDLGCNARASTPKNGSVA